MCVLQTLRCKVNVYASFILPISMFKLCLMDQNSVPPATAVHHTNKWGFAQRGAVSGRYSAGHKYGID